MELDMHAETDPTLDPCLYFRLFAILPVPWNLISTICKISQVSFTSLRHHSFTPLVLDEAVSVPQGHLQAYSCAHARILA